MGAEEGTERGLGGERKEEENEKRTERTRGGKGVGSFGSKKTCQQNKILTNDRGRASGVLPSPGRAPGGRSRAGSWADGGGGVPDALELLAEASGARLARKKETERGRSADCAKAHNRIQSAARAWKPGSWRGGGQREGVGCLCEWATFAIQKAHPRSARFRRLLSTRV